EALDDLRMRPEKRSRIVDGEIEHLVNVKPTVANGEDRALKAASLARLALHFEVGHEVHLDGNGSGASTSFAAAPGEIEGKVFCLDFLTRGFRRRGEHLSNLGGDLQIGRGIRGHRACR